MSQQSIELSLCKCGCGMPVKEGNTFICFHHWNVIHPKIFKTCICGKTFRVSPSKHRIFCSRKCYNQFHRADKICPICSKPFNVNLRSSRIYCSIKCLGIAHRGANNPLYGLKGIRNSASSQAVRMKISATKMGILNPNWKPRKKILCVICQKEFQVLPSSKRESCSKECSVVLCRQRMKTDNPMFNPQTREKMQDTSKQRIRDGLIVPFLATERGRDIISKMARERALKDNPMKNPETARAAYIGTWTNGKRKRSFLEESFLTFIEKHQLPIIFVGDGTIWIARRTPDFRILGQKKCIEIGCSVFRGEEYINQTKKHFENHGWQCLVILLKHNELFEREDFFLQQVKEFVGDTN